MGGCDYCGRDRRGMSGAHGCLSQSQAEDCYHYRHVMDAQKIRDSQRRVVVSGAVKTGRSQDISGRSCTCASEDNPPRPCPGGQALSTCRAAALEDALREFLVPEMRTLLPGRFDSNYMMLAGTLAEKLMRGPLAGVGVGEVAVRDVPSAPGHLWQAAQDFFSIANYLGGYVDVRTPESEYQYMMKISRMAAELGYKFQELSRAEGAE